VKPPFHVEVTRYGRFWAVHVDDELLVIAVYKKGAHAVKSFIERIR